MFKRWRRGFVVAEKRGARARHKTRELSSLHRRCRHRHRHRRRRRCFQLLTRFKFMFEIGSPFVYNGTRFRKQLCKCNTGACCKQFFQLF